VLGLLLPLLLWLGWRSLKRRERLNARGEEVPVT
jgi:hypothetical protein